MSDLIEKANNWLGGMFKKHTSQLVIYVHEGIQIPDMSAMLLQGPQVVNSDQLTSLEENEADWIILVTDLGFEPTVDDKIIFKNVTYHVHRRPHESHWRYADAYLNSYRILTAR